MSVICMSELYFECTFAGVSCQLLGGDPRSFEEHSPPNSGGSFGSLQAGVNFWFHADETNHVARRLVHPTFRLYDLLQSAVRIAARSLHSPQTSRSFRHRFHFTEN